MSRIRDHKAEYQRRLARAAARGLSRSQARGHARWNEAPIRPRPEPDTSKLEEALKALHQTGHQRNAARSAHVSTERLRRFLRESGFAERRGKSWHFSDNRVREMTVISDGDARMMMLRGFDEASLNGRYLAAVKKFLRSNNRDLLLPFEGLSIIDADGERHPLETDPNALHRLASAGSEVFHDVYRLIQ